MFDLLENFKITWLYYSSCEKNGYTPFNSNIKIKFYRCLLYLCVLANSVKLFSPAYDLNTFAFMINVFFIQFVTDILHHP